MRMSEALRIAGVVAAITGVDLEERGLAWMPTLTGDRQMVLATDTVMFDGQEVVAILAEDRYSAADAAAAVEIDYEPLPPVVDAQAALQPGAAIVRPDRDPTSNRIWHWENGDAAAAARSFDSAAVKVQQDFIMPRVHGAAIETIGCVASWDSEAKHLTLWASTHTPQVTESVLGTAASHLGITPQNITIHDPDIGGAAGSKVLTSPGYVLAAYGSLITGRPVKWIEDRIAYLKSEGYGGDYRISAEAAATPDGQIQAIRVKTITDRGYANAGVDPTAMPEDLYPVAPTPYALKAMHIAVDAVYTNKPPAGIAYRRTLRVTDSVFATERLVDTLAHTIGVDPATLRLQNFVGPASADGSTPDHARALERAMARIGYWDLRREQAERRARGELIGIGVGSAMEILRAGPSRVLNIQAMRSLQGATRHKTPDATYPFGSQVCVVDIDRETGRITVRRFVGVHGSGDVKQQRALVTEVYGPMAGGFAPAMLEAVTYDDQGTNVTSSFLDYLLATAVETPRWEFEQAYEGIDGGGDKHNPGEVPTVVGQVALVNAVVDALWHLGVRNVEIPMTPARIWRMLQANRALSS
ncbi:MAG: carbon-monoxide dehydrogenase, large subunit [Chloroflexi bacterium]|nr:carbon-monoxide dehydrogenase, large subunit [Chloroflexota bacterium]